MPKKHYMFIMFELGQLLGHSVQFNAFDIEDTSKLGHDHNGIHTKGAIDINYNTRIIPAQTRLTRPHRNPAWKRKI